MKKLITALTIASFIGVIVCAFMIYDLQKKSDSLGAVAIPEVIALFETSLASKVTSSATTMTLETGTDKESNTLSGTYGFVIDEGSSNEEFVQCTAAGTALTGCSRGLSVSAPASTSASLQKSHRRGASVKVTNYPVLGVLKRLIDGTDDFPAIITYDSTVADCLADDDICQKSYVDSVAVAGASDGNLTTKGIFEMATIAEINAGTGYGSTLARLAVNPSYLASSNYASWLPTSDQKAALAGSSGSPSATNLYITGDDVSSSSFSDTTDYVVRSDGDAIPSGLFLDASKLTITASASGDLLVNNGSAFGRLASAGADDYMLVASDSASFDMQWQDGSDYFAAGYETNQASTFTHSSSVSFDPNLIKVFGGMSCSGCNGGASVNITHINGTSTWAAGDENGGNAGTGTATLQYSSGNTWTIVVSESADKDTINITCTKGGSPGNLSILWTAQRF